MDSLYLSLKFLHIAAVIVWIGGVFALALLSARIGHGGNPALAAAMGQQSAAFGRTVLGPAMGVTVIAGLWMAGQFGIPFTAAWIVWGVVGFVAVFLLGVIVTGRIAAELGALMRAGGGDAPRVAILRQRLNLLSVLNLLLLASVVWVMVFKPTL